MQRRGDRRVRGARGDQAEHLALAAGEPGDRAGLEPQPVPHQGVDDVRVDDALAATHRLQRRHQVLDVGDPLLEQVAAPGAAPGHQGQRSLGVGVLGQHDDPELGVGATEALGGADALVGVRGRHPDVGEHDVGLLLADRVEQLAEVTGLDDLVDRGVLGQERDEALTEQHAVLREHHAHPGHACMVGGRGRGATGHRATIGALPCALRYRQDGGVLPDLFLRPAERDNPHTVIDDHHPEGVAWSEGNRVRPIVHGRPYMAELHERVERAGGGRPPLLRRLARRPRPAADRRPGLDGVGDVRGRRPARRRRARAALALALEQVRLPLREVARCSASRSTRPAASACATCGCAPAARTTRSSSCCGTATTPRATSPSSAASTCATADATTSGTRATAR